MTKLYLVRHAEAEGNVFRRAHGHIDGRLTSNGWAQLPALAARFARIPLDAVYASDLTRARETARAIADSQGLPVHTSPALREICLGLWEGLPWGRLAHEKNRDYLLFSEGELDFHIPCGENGREVRLRMTAELTALARSHDGQTLCVVSHGAALQYFMSAFGPVGLFTLDNTSVSLCRYEEGVFYLDYAGDNDHLGALSTFARVKEQRSGRPVNRAELWFRPALPESEREELISLGLDAWQAVYGTAEGYDGDLFFRACSEARAICPRFVQYVLHGDSVVGLLQWNDSKRLRPSDGHIGLLYLREEMCGRRLGVQLLGEALDVAREQRRTHLALRVWEQNLRARAFYAQNGFVAAGREEGLFGPLIIMRRAV